MSPTSFRVRDFEPADQTGVEAMIRNGLRERWGDAFDASLNEDLTDIAGNYQSKGTDVVVVDIESEIVATGFLVPELQRQCRIVRVSVSENMRRRGLARAVLSELVTRAKEHNMLQINVRTDTPWASAVALYKALGFKEVGRDDTDTCFRLGLQLTAGENKLAHNKPARLRRITVALQPPT